MAVLVEAISVIVRADAIPERYEGGWPAFQQEVPNQTLCADGELARVGLMAPADVERYVHHLESRGLRFLDAGKSVDIVVVDQTRGAMQPCDWIDFGHVDRGDCGQKLAAARLRGSTSHRIVSPDGWQYERSLSAAHGFVPSEQAGERLRYLRTVAGVDAYLDLQTGKEVRIGRTR